MKKRLTLQEDFLTIRFNSPVNDNTATEETDEAIEEMLMANPHLAKYVAPMRVHNLHIQ